jgi:hypothetical protein
VKVTTYGKPFYEALESVTFDEDIVLRIKDPGASREKFEITIKAGSVMVVR